MFNLTLNDIILEINLMYGKEFIIVSQNRRAEIPQITSLGKFL